MIERNISLSRNSLYMHCGLLPDYVTTLQVNRQLVVTSGPHAYLFIKKRHLLFSRRDANNLIETTLQTKTCHSISDHNTLFIMNLK